MKRLLITLIVLIAVISSQNANFFTTINLLYIGSAVTIMGLLALVQTVVIICGALDISVGSTAGLTSVISAMVFESTGHNAGLGILAALGIGLVCGLVNGAIIIFGRVNPVVATLGTLATFKGFAQVVSNGKSQSYTGADDLFTFLAKGSIAGLPTLVWVFLTVAIVLHLQGRRVVREFYYNDAGVQIATLAASVKARLDGVWGARDATAYPHLDDRARALRSIQPGARFEVIPGAGHWVQFEAAERFNPLLAELAGYPK